MSIAQDRNEKYGKDKLRNEVHNAKNILDQRRVVQRGYHRLVVVDQGSIEHQARHLWSSLVNH